MPYGVDEDDPPGGVARSVIRTLRATLDAIHKEDNRIGGRAVTKLEADLEIDDTVGALVESTIGFGELYDTNNATYTLIGDGGPLVIPFPKQARLLIGGEIIEANDRRSRYPFEFVDLTRGVSNTVQKKHPKGTLVYDYSQNTSAIDHIRRGFLVEYAVGEDLEILARNLGLHRCPGFSQETLRRVIKAVAYLPKQTIDAFRIALEALLDGTNFTITERTTSEPWVVYVEVAIEVAEDIRGRFILNGGEPQVTVGFTTTLLTSHFIYNVFGVYLDTPLTRRGFREGFTNFYSGGGSFLPAGAITLGSSPGPVGTAVIVDYTAVEAHYLATDETVRQDVEQGDRWAYLADPLLAAKCLLDQVRAAGVQVRLSAAL